MITHNSYFFTGHVFIPNIEYIGQKPKAAVSIGINPIKPINFKLPGIINKRLNNIIPMIYLINLSVLPIFFILKSPFKLSFTIPTV